MALYRKSRSAPKALFKAMSASRFSWAQCVSELFDNSVDADSHTIRLDLAMPQLTIQDDGVGMTPDIMNQLLVPGTHIQLPTTRTGTWGVGLKDVLAYLQANVAIMSIRDKVQSTADVHLERWLHDPDWGIPVHHRVIRSGIQGTAFTFDDILRRAPSSEQFRRMVSDLSFSYTPALREGRHMEMRYETAEPIRLAPYVPVTAGEPITQVFVIEGSDPPKRAHLWVARRDVADPGMHSGLQWFKGPRFNEMDSQRAIPQQYSRSGIYGMVELEGPWIVSRNKDAFDDPDLEDIESAVYELIEPLLREHAEQSMYLADLELSLGVADTVNTVLGRKRAAVPGGPGPSRGTRGRGGTGGIPLVERDPSRRDSSGPQSAMQVKREPLEAHYGWGVRKRNVIELSRHDPFIERWWTHPDRVAAREMLACVALVIYESSPEREKETRTADIQDRLQSHYLPARLAARMERIYANPDAVRFL